MAIPSLKMGQYSNNTFTSRRVVCGSDSELAHVPISSCGAEPEQCQDRVSLPPAQVTVLSSYVAPQNVTLVLILSSNDSDMGHCVPRQNQ